MTFIDEYLLLTYGVVEEENFIDSEKIEEMAIEEEEEEEEFQRVRTPKDNELIGVIDSRLGHGRLSVICSDKKIRVCRVPGKYRRKIWLREGDVVIVVPWQFEGDKKGDVIYKYRKAAIEWLRKNGYLDNLDI